MSLKTYKATKIVSAKPMTRGEYNVMKGWTIPADEDPNDDGGNGSDMTDKQLIDNVWIGHNR